MYPYDAGIEWSTCIGLNEMSPTCISSCVLNVLKLRWSVTFSHDFVVVSFLMSMMSFVPFPRKMSMFSFNSGTYP